MLSKDSWAHRPNVRVGVAAPAPRRYRRPTVLACVGLTVIATLSTGVATVAAADSGETATSAVEASRDVVAAVESWGPRSPYPGYGSGRSTHTQTGAQAEAERADTAESAGIVLIETVLGYQDSAAAGTGIVLTSDGLIMTNNHVIDGATEISVTIASTGETYDATLVGTDTADDVALLQVDVTSPLTTATLDDDGSSIGDAVTAVGNADGGGVLMAADGEITDLESTVTTAPSGYTDGETLTGMIEFAADVVGGDSGGALRDAEGEVIGMTTAASAGTAVTSAWAVPIHDAIAIVNQILSGDESDGVTLGYPAFLGVQMGSSIRTATGPYGRGTTESGAIVSGVIDATPAAAVGLVSGDTIVGVDGTAVNDSAALGEILGTYDPGDQVTLTWVDAAGTSHSASVTLAAGPA